MSTEKLLIRGKTIKGRSFVIVDVQEDKSAEPAEAGNLLKTQYAAESPRGIEIHEKETYSSSQKIIQFHKKESEKIELEKKEDTTRSVSSLRQDPDQLVYTISQKEVVLDEDDNILEVLKNHHLFKNLAINILKNMIEEMSGFDIEAGTFVYREGEDGTCFFIIKKGIIEVSVNGERKKLLKEGECFGELALLHKCTRSTTLVALTDVEFYVLDGAYYRELNQNFMRMKIGDVLFYIDLIPWLRSLDHTSKTTLARLTVLQEFEANQKISSLFLPDDKIFIIKQGSLSAVGKYSSEKIKFIHRDYFGEKWIFKDENFQFMHEVYEAITLEKSYIYIIPKSSIEEALGMNYKELILRSFFKELIYHSQFFNNFFVEKHFDDLFDISTLKYFSKGQTVYNIDYSTNKKIIFILEGGLVDVRIHL